MTQVDQLLNIMAATLMTGTIVYFPRDAHGSNDKIIFLLIKSTTYIYSIYRYLVCALILSLINPEWHNQHLDP